jgi:DNA-binding MarR family transcriptional regulator
MESDMQDDVVDLLLRQWGRERPELDVSGLSVVVRIQLLAKMLRRQTERQLAPLGLEVWEYDVLAALRRQGRPFELPATALARETLLSTGAMTNRIDRLEERGAVRRRHDPADRRCILVSLTSAGRRLVDEAIQRRLEAADETLSALSRAERRRLADLLRMLTHEVGLAPPDAAAGDDAPRQASGGRS